MYVVGVFLGEAYYSSGFVYGFVWEYIFVKVTNSPLTIPTANISIEKFTLCAREDSLSGMVIPIDVLTLSAM
jgi:hypothetical protein